MSFDYKQAFKNIAVDSDVDVQHVHLRPKLSSTRLKSTSSLFTNNLPKMNRPSGVCGYWNKTEVAQNILDSKSQKIQQPTLSRPIELADNFEGNSQHSNVVPTSEMSREEIIIQRKLKAVDLKKKKKQERQEKKVPVTEIRALEPDFFLEQSSEEFPLLSTARSSKKRHKFNPNVNVNENSNERNCTRQYKGLDKSWKPKVKDPISINLGQVLQAKPEKFKTIVKKVDPNAQRNIYKGNILDSDNPQQKKGKVRPDKEKKPTKLKTQILQGRKERQTQIQSEKQEQSPSSDVAQIIQEEELTRNTLQLVDVEQPFEENNRNSNSNVSEEINSLLFKCNLLETEVNEISNNKHNSLNSEQEVKFEITKTFHSRKFREYCTNCLTENIITSVCALLEKLAYFQDRTFGRDPIKAQAKRRYVAGISQTNKYLLVKKVKLLVIAPDLEKNSGEGGLDDIVTNFKNIADNQDVPCVFGPKRKRLGKAVFKNALVSCVAVLSYEGAEEQFSRVLEALNDAKMKYQALIKGDSINYDEKDSRAIVELADKEYISADEVTSSLLAVLKGNQSPADKLLNAIHKADWSSLDT